MKLTIKEDGLYSMSSSLCVDFVVFFSHFEVRKLFLGPVLGRSEGASKPKCLTTAHTGIGKL